MDLNNTIRKNNLVILKEGIKEFSINGVVFKPNKFYRSIFLENESQTEVLIYGEIFVNENYSNLFELAYDRVIRDFKLCGFIKDNGKLVSKTKFSQIIDIHTYGGGVSKLYKGFAYTMKDRGVYSFQTNFRENKKTFITATYGYLTELFNGEMDSIDSKLVQYGNCGIGLTYNHNLNVR